jgi:uncharacterized protein
MIDWQRIIGFQWDNGNARKSIEKHCVGQAEAEQIFLHEPLLIASDQRHSTNETRLHALGRTDEGRLLHITFTLRADQTQIRIVSARDMSRKERSHYEP